MEEVEINGRFGNKNARFWTRPDIKRAMLALDVWANQKWHSERIPYQKHEVRVVESMGGRTVDLQSIPVGEERSVGGDESALTAEAATGKRRTTEATREAQKTSVSAFKQGALHRSKEIMLIIDMLIGKDHVLAGLVLWLYPKHGVYHYDKDSTIIEEIDGIEVQVDIRTSDQTVPRKYSTYRPASFVQSALEAYSGKDPGRYLDGLLKRMERDLLVSIASHLNTFTQPNVQAIDRTGAAVSAQIRHNESQFDRETAMAFTNSNLALKLLPE